MANHKQARALARQALQTVFSGEPTLGEIEALTGVGWLETCYGAGWRGSGKGSNNMGAIQAGSSWKGDTFTYTDTHPNADGSSTPYRVAFRKYATPLEGWIDLARVAFVNRGRATVRAAAQQCDWLGVSTALHSTGYYEGFGRTVADRIGHHYAALSKAIALADAAENKAEVPPTVRFGSTGETVKELQRELGVVADGIFGKITLGALRGFQSTHGLVVDGICGPVTWTTILIAHS